MYLFKNEKANCKEAQTKIKWNTQATDKTDNLYHLENNKNSVSVIAKKKYTRNYANSFPQF
jgi:uncharacterized protein YdhG (YjbR/CyaY superfamily)